MNQVFVKPTDVLLFRDGRAFSPQDAQIAKGIFPPPPIPFYGAFRSAMLSQNNAVFRKKGSRHWPYTVSKEVRGEVGLPEELGQLSIDNFALARDKGSYAEPLYVMPQDVVKLKGACEYDIAKPEDMPEGVLTNIPAQRLVWHRPSEMQEYENAKGLLPQPMFQQYLEGRAPAHDEITRAGAVYTKELRTSVQINDSSFTTGDGDLFTVEFIRMNEHLGFSIALDGASCLQKPSGLLRLGGESRGARYTIKEASLMDTTLIKKQIAGNDLCFKLVLTTAAVFDKGWYDSSWMGREGDLNGCPVEFIAASVERYQHIGGWDMAAGRPKRTRRAVAPGAVYYFKLLGDIDTLFDVCFGRSVTPLNEDRKQGLGIAYLGAWKDVINKSK